MYISIWLIKLIFRGVNNIRTKPSPDYQALIIEMLLNLGKKESCFILSYNVNRNLFLNGHINDVLLIYGIV